MNTDKRSQLFDETGAFTCPDCNSDVAFSYDGGESIPENGWKRFITVMEEYSVVTKAECANCEWEKISRVEVHDPTSG